jgi:CheY-like chemotaxis protein
LLMDMAREKGFKAVTCGRGDTGLALANELRPDAVVLDIRLAGGDGWQMLSRLKRDPATRHIPVHVITVSEERRRGPGLHAFGFVTKPVTKEILDTVFANVSAFLERDVRRLLVVEDDTAQREAIVALLGAGGDVQAGTAASAEEAIAELERGEPYDCMIVDLGLPDRDGYDLIEKLKSNPRFKELPILVYTGRDLLREEEARLRRIVDALVPKGSPEAPQRLLDEASLLLHRPDDRIPEPQRRNLAAIRGTPSMEGKKALVVDDDVRNIFAITSALEGWGLEVLYAENGQAALDTLEQHPDIAVVLMDVMMPGMDGYQTMRAIRQNPRLRSVPIVAVTAKALKDDRDKCMDAGASEYLPKPVDLEKLEKLLRVWLVE